MTARPIMVQGTMSNVGKSILCAGLCRIFAQDGYRVRPFKSQNMALNSAVTADGRELGRAQAMQAEAAGVAADVRMNPVLLKPETDRGSQVIVRGLPRATMQATDYFAFKHELVDEVRACYDELAAESDIIVIEGAGSPAEINLRHDDFVNMGMAHMVGAPVILAGDVDPGGVFAQLYGTLQLFDKADRSMVKAMIVNKFRGDVNILMPGITQLERLCGMPVLGVVPMMHMDLDDEDSLSSRLAARGQGAGTLDVAVIRLPRLSNFTDFNELDRHPLVGVRYVREAAELGRPDLVIIPGTKSTMADLSFLRQQGLDVCIRRLAEQGTLVMGVCGGYQMLGERLYDPAGVEGGGEAAGLGLLPTTTTFADEKSLVAGSGRLSIDAGGDCCSIDGLDLIGYEIHMGATELCAGATDQGRVTTSDGRVVGHVSGNVLGTYLHGFFDAPGIVEAFVRLLMERRGLAYAPVQAEPREAYRQRQYDLLAEGLRQALDIQKVYEILEAGA
ncbi:cobyric acid synthase [Paratractidigestivibacter sp.]|uniref:cobyric acid synthase n=1 Tax=Paratractidigestivibacter sp. TaxID=2847316 RepID=UPI002ABE3D01|nr:cobyric acid synthase [Paratractidigestivibacter sp.]